MLVYNKFLILCEITKDFFTLAFRHLICSLSTQLLDFIKTLSQKLQHLGKCSKFYLLPNLPDKTQLLFGFSIKKPVRCERKAFRVPICQLFRNHHSPFQVSTTFSKFNLPILRGWKFLSIFNFSLCLCYNLQSPYSKFQNYEITVDTVVEIHNFANIHTKIRHSLQYYIFYAELEARFWETKTLCLYFGINFIYIK